MINAYNGAWYHHYLKKGGFNSINLMSFYTMFRKSKDVKLEGAAFISLAGLKPTIPKRLQEQGVDIISCVVIHAGNNLNSLLFVDLILQFQMVQKIRIVQCDCLRRPAEMPGGFDWRMCV